MSSIVVKRPDGSLSVKSVNEEPSLTRQSFKDQTDIVQIMKKYHKGESIAHLARNPGRYADLTQIKDYAKSLQTVIDAQNAFGVLPSEIRKRFNNDPQELLEFLQDDSNKSEAIGLGLIDKPVASVSGDVPPKKTDS